MVSDYAPLAIIEQGSACGLLAQLQQAEGVVHARVAIENPPSARISCWPPERLPQPKMLRTSLSALLLALALLHAPAWGQRRRSPVLSPTPPPDASARCRDGYYSFSRYRRGTCSGHGGVAEWLGAIG